MHPNLAPTPTHALNPLPNLNLYPTLTLHGGPGIRGHTNVTRPVATASGSSPRSLAQGVAKPGASIRPLLSDLVNRDTQGGGHRFVACPGKVP